jgi:phospholipase C
LTDQSSVLRFIEDTWLGGQRIGQGSFDSLASPINQMFDFSESRNGRLFLHPSTGQPFGRLTITTREATVSRKRAR